MDKLDKYDDMEGEVDFPNWWQSKLTLAIRLYSIKSISLLRFRRKNIRNNDIKILKRIEMMRVMMIERVDESLFSMYGKRKVKKTIKPCFLSLSIKIKKCSKIYGMI